MRWGMNMREEGVGSGEDNCSGKSGGKNGEDLNVCPRKKKGIIKSEWNYSLRGEMNLENIKKTREKGKKKESRT